MAGNAARDGPVPGADPPAPASSRHEPAARPGVESSRGAMRDGVQGLHRGMQGVVLAAGDPLADPELILRARALGVPVRERAGLPAATPVIVASVTGWELRRAASLEAPGLRLDLTPRRPGATGHRSPRQPLVRAIGKAPRSVWDGTAGTGKDALLLAELGHDVTATERCGPLALLLLDAWQRLAARDPSGAATRLRFRHGELVHVLSREHDATGVLPEVIFLDPMFPPRRRASARPRKAMQILRELLGEEPADPVEARALVAASRALVTDRVVVKRPREAPPLVASPRSSHAGKLVRYDVYAATPDAGATRQPGEQREAPR